MQDLFIYQGKEKLRCGYTTGSSAAAAAKAAFVMLINKSVVNKVEINTPFGTKLSLNVLEPEIGEVCRASIRKDSGDDPDVTNGIIIRADVTFSGEYIQNKNYTAAEKIRIYGGTGVGTVTKDGLDQPVGASAINHVPREMIKKEILSAYSEMNGLNEIISEDELPYTIDVCINAIGGEEIAKKTFNERLGIVGGISIIGTSGIVKPMSEEALIDTIEAEIKVRRAEGRSALLITLGNYGEDFIKENIPSGFKHSVMCSNYIGRSVDLAIENGFSDIVIVGHIGKLVKLGAGIMNTHSKEADGRIEVLITTALLAGADNSLLQSIVDSVTTDDVLDKFREYDKDHEGFFDRAMQILTDRIEFYLEQRVKGACEISAVVFSNKHGLLGKTKKADNILEKIKLEDR